MGFLVSLYTCLSVRRGEFCNSVLIDDDRDHLERALYERSIATQLARQGSFQCPRALHTVHSTRCAKNRCPGGPGRRRRRQRHFRFGLVGLGGRRPRLLITWGAQGPARRQRGRAGRLDDLQRARLQLLVRDRALHPRHELQKGQGRPQEPQKIAFRVSDRRTAARVTRGPQFVSTSTGVEASRRRRESAGTRSRRADLFAGVFCAREQLVPSRFDVCHLSPTTLRDVN